MVHLQQTAERLCNEQRCKATRRTYKYAWKNFNDLLVAWDTMPVDWDDRIIIFAAQLIVEERPEATIKSHVSAVKAILEEDGESASIEIQFS